MDMAKGCWHYHFRGREGNIATRHRHDHGHLWHEHSSKGLYGYGRKKKSLKRKR